MDQAAIQALIQLAEQVLQDTSDRDLTIEIAEKYTCQFADWFESNKAAFAQELPESQVREIERLNLLHGKVLKLLGTWKTETLQELRSQRARGKGVMAYLDTLPKKISILKSHKG